MKKSLYTSAAMLVLMSGTALGADLRPAPAYKAPPPVVAPAFSWTGFYVGGHVGYGWGRATPGRSYFYDDPNGASVADIPGIAYNINGVMGGGQIGYNFQIGNFVLGIEGDISGTGIKGGVTSTEFGYTVNSKLEWLATVRGRIGFAVDRVLFYGTGGYATGRAKVTLDDVYDGGATIITTTDSKQYHGWTAGGGVEFAVDQNWTVKAEYLHVNLGSAEFNFYQPSPPGWPRIRTSASTRVDVVRVGFNYKF